MIGSWLLNWRVVAVALVLTGLAATHWKAYTAGRNGVQAAWNAERLEIAQQTLRIMEKNTRTSQELQRKADQTKATKNEQIDRINADLALALERLHNRPARPGESSLPGDTATGPNPGCTGAQLWQEDAGFLRREAARADRLLADLAQCQVQYNAAREAVK
jgi:hypothetical protein